MMHGFSLRFDPELKRDLNLRLNDDQPTEIVLENRKKFVRSVSAGNPFYHLRQIHSDRITRFEHKPFYH